MNVALVESTCCAERLAAVEERIAAACRRAGRPRREVTLVAVTKKVSPELAALLPNLGVLDLGESRPQELVAQSGGVAEDGALASHRPSATEQD